MNNLFENLQMMKESDEDKIINVKLIDVEVLGDEDDYETWDEHLNELANEYNITIEANGERSILISGTRKNIEEFLYSEYFLDFDSSHVVVIDTLKEAEENLNSEFNDRDKLVIKLLIPNYNVEGYGFSRWLKEKYKVKVLDIPEKNKNYVILSGEYVNIKQLEHIFNFSLSNSNNVEIIKHLKANNNSNSNFLTSVTVDVTTNKDDEYYINRREMEMEYNIKLKYKFFPNSDVSQLTISGDVDDIINYLHDCVYDEPLNDYYDENDTFVKVWIKKHPHEDVNDMLNA